ncbi:hypothetical protein D3C80_1485530 [compost metagenome]
MVTTMTGTARPSGTRQIRLRKGRRSFNPLTNNENTTATSVKCSIQPAAFSMSRCSTARPAGPMANPSTRQTADVVTGSQRK